jgi:phosphatidylserine decarboxylase
VGLLLVCSIGVIIYFMRIPLTKYGLPDVVLLAVMLIGLMILVILAGLYFLTTSLVIAIEVILLSVLIIVLAFFRDPYRAIPADKDVLLAPADGKITDIELVEENTFLHSRALRVGIFMDLFSAHINRFPCAVKIEKVTHKPGRYKNAMKLVSSQVNEANNIALIRLDEPTDKLLVRQIAGAIARRIVCEARPGENFRGGQKFGMVKFGSRAELYLPVRPNAKCVVKVGDKVKAGLNVLVRYEREGNQGGSAKEEV